MKVLEKMMMHYIKIFEQYREFVATVLELCSRLYLMIFILHDFNHNFIQNMKHDILPWTEKKKQYNL